MTAITVDELIVLLQKIRVDDKQNGSLPCYIYPEGGQDVLLDYEIQIQKADYDTLKKEERPKRLLIG